MNSGLKFELLAESDDELNTRCLDLLNSFYDISKIRAEVGTLVLPLISGDVKLSFEGDFLLLERNHVNYHLKNENGEFRVFINRQSAVINNELIQLLEDVKDYFDQVRGTVEDTVIELGSIMK